MQKKRKKRPFVLPLKESEEERIEREIDEEEDRLEEKKLIQGLVRKGLNLHPIDYEEKNY